MRRLLVITALGVLTVGVVMKLTESPPGIGPSSAAPAAAPTPGRAEHIRIRSVCDAPLSVRIGQVDPQFPIGREEFEAAVNAATQEWEDATGRNWFRSAADGEISVNLLFDGRQEDLQRQTAAQESVEKRIEELRSRSNAGAAEARRFNETILEWRAKETSLAKRAADYRNVLFELHRSGDIPPEVLMELQREKLAIAQLMAEVMNERAFLQSEIENHSASEVALNAVRDSIKEEISALRRNFPERSFTEGQHVSGGPINEIHIFTYQNPEELHLALLHELGHAIGVPHLEAEAAVMNPLRRMGSGDFHLSRADVAGALRICPETAAKSKH